MTRSGSRSAPTRACAPRSRPIGEAGDVLDPPSSAGSVIVWDRNRIAGTELEKNQLAGRLEALRAATGGVVVDVGADTRIQDLNGQATLHPGCVYAKNLVASAIRDIVRTYDNDNLQYVVLVGGDSSVPFFRYPDPSDLAPESVVRSAGR